MAAKKKPAGGMPMMGTYAKKTTKAPPTKSTPMKKGAKGK